MNQTSLPLGGKDPWKPLDIPPHPGPGIHIGTSGYHFEDWVGPFYPPRRPSRYASAEEKEGRDRFLFYQKYFSFLEINSTFYKEPVLQQFLDWERRSGPNMMFSVKVHQGISHKGIWRIEDGKALMEKHMAAVGPLVESGRFYSFLIQLEEHVEKRQDVLDYLMRVAAVAVGKRLDVHIEFRNITWHHEYVLQTLKDSGVGLCNTDIPKVRHAFPLKSYATSDKGYVRYSGLNLESWSTASKRGNHRENDPLESKHAERIRSRNARYDYLYSEAEMAERVQGQLRLLEKTENLAVAFNNHYQIKAILNAIRNIHLLRNQYGAGAPD